MSLSQFTTQNLSDLVLKNEKPGNFVPGMSKLVPGSIASKCKVTCSCLKHLMLAFSHFFLLDFQFSFSTFCCFGLLRSKFPPMGLTRSSKETPGNVPESPQNSGLNFCWWLDSHKIP